MADFRIVSIGQKCNTSLFPLFFYIPGYQKRSKNPCQMVHYSISVYDPTGICKTCIKSINLCKRPASNWYLSVVKDHLLKSWFIYLVSNDLNKLACIYEVKVRAGRGGVLRKFQGKLRDFLSWQSSGQKFVHHLSDHN